MSETELGEQTEEFWEDFYKIEGVEIICDLWDKAFNCWVIEDIANMLIKHRIVSPPVRWTEITDDPATWPPANVVVLTRNGENVIGMHFHGDSDEPLWWQPENLFVDAPPDSMDGPIAWEDYSLSDSQNITHWRPI